MERRPSSMASREHQASTTLRRTFHLRGLCCSQHPLPRSSHQRSMKQFKHVNESTRGRMQSLDVLWKWMMLNLQPNVQKRKPILCSTCMSLRSDLVLRHAMPYGELTVQSKTFVTLRCGSKTKFKHTMRPNLEMDHLLQTHTPVPGTRLWLRWTPQPQQHPRLCWAQLPPKHLCLQQQLPQPHQLPSRLIWPHQPLLMRKLILWLLGPWWIQCHRQAMWTRSHLRQCWLWKTNWLIWPSTRRDWPRHLDQFPHHQQHQQPTHKHPKPKPSLHQ